MEKIQVDLDELLTALEQVKEEGYVTVEVAIQDDGYDRDLRICAVALEGEDECDFVRIPEISDI